MAPLYQPPPTGGLTPPKATYRAIKSEAARRGCSMRDMVVEWAATLARG